MRAPVMRLSRDSARDGAGLAERLEAALARVRKCDDDVGSRADPPRMGHEHKAAREGERALAR
jgi:hypothetical protein